MMARTNQRRKHDLKAAIAYLGLTQGQWCAASGVDPSHLARVLAGDRESLTLNRKIDAVILEFRKKVIRDAASAGVQTVAA
jgi:predicted transcriptional regulator